MAAIHYGSLGRALAEDLPDLMAKRDQVVNELEVLQKGSTGEQLQWATQKGKKTAGLDRFVVLARLWYRDLLALTCRLNPGS